MRVRCALGRRGLKPGSPLALRLELAWTCSRAKKPAERNPLTVTASEQRRGRSAMLPGSLAAHLGRWNLAGANLCAPGSGGPAVHRRLGRVRQVVLGC